ncbi:Gag-Pol polyprotein [Gossypium australe]|uniref:Gag-Pol polyprotein n=1 Tax=Gossypium australe TaxID=47621 RepID=A0A5B6WS03_9ROSI|nr:Gag-Pol polyprotein [Gossypium australe]
MDPERVIADNVESKAPAPTQGTALSDSRSATNGQKGEAKQAFFQMMSEWFTQFVRNNPAVPQPPPPSNPPQTSVVPPEMGINLLHKPPIDKIRKYGAEEFRATSDDDAEKAEFWLENTIRVFDEMSLSPKECIKCVVSLPRDAAYQWWKTLVSVVPKEQGTWDFFQIEFRKKYISQRFIDQKRKEFLDLKHGRMPFTEFELEFVTLSQYARECVSTEVIMCKRFEDGLNKDIRLLFGIMEIKEFVVLVDRAGVRKRFPSKSFQSASKKFRDEHSHSRADVGQSNRDRPRSQSNLKAPATSMASVGNVLSDRPECKYCGKRHPTSCRLNGRACFRCGSLDHFIRDCPESVEQETAQNTRSDNVPARGRPSRNTRNVSGSQRTTRDTVARSEARAPARAYAIRAREEASSPYIITSTFTLYDTFVIALIDLGSTHSYVCMNLVSSKTFPVESTEFAIKVLNPLGKSVLVDKVCKNCPLMFRNICFPTGLMLLPFVEFDIILGMDWLTLHDAVVNYKRKTINLRCQNGEIVRVKSNDLNGLPAVISVLKALSYVKKGYKAYFAYKVESVPVVCEFSDVFPEELPGLPLIREVEFGIGLLRGTTPISIALYRMAPIDMKELKSQLQDFERLKPLLTEASVLVQPESAKEFVVYSDASFNGLGWC